MLMVIGHKLYKNDNEQNLKWAKYKQARENN